jgi:hypothetical protein
MVPFFCQDDMSARSFTLEYVQRFVISWSEGEYIIKLNRPCFEGIEPSVKYPSTFIDWASDSDLDLARSRT